MSGRAPVPDGFAAAVSRVLAGLEPGDVVTYGEVAREAGYPGAARAVGNLLAADRGDLPWWRVVRADGRLAACDPADQARRLRAEGVRVEGGLVRGEGVRCRAVEPDLRRLLDELHAAIERTEEGAEDRRELTRLVEAVERRLHADADADAGSERHGHLVDSLRQAEVRFESDHPVLGAALRRAVDALSAAGI